MADITVRKAAPSAPAKVEVDPFRSMRDFMRWDPFKEMAPLWNAELSLEFNPAFEVKETEQAWLFKADVPGVKESDLQVTVTGNRLQVSGTRHEEKEEKGETFFSRERKYGSFTRSYTLPDGADLEHVRAELKAGVLTIAVPRMPNAQPRKIEVKAPGTSQ
jgi:HSP20 family protein